MFCSGFKPATSSPIILSLRYYATLACVGGHAHNLFKQHSLDFSFPLLSPTSSTFFPIIFHHVSTCAAPMLSVLSISPISLLIHSLPSLMVAASRSPLLARPTSHHLQPSSPQSQHSQVPHCTSLLFLAHACPLLLSWVPTPPPLAASHLLPWQKPHITPMLAQRPLALVLIITKHM